jgi:hypothetical protein
MNRRLIVALLVAGLVAVPTYADFASVARAIDQRNGVKRNWIPFLGLARFAVWVVRPEGVHDFQLVTFEGADRLDPKELHNILRTQIGPGYTPLVQHWSRRKAEWSFIYAKPQGKHIDLVILAHDDEDTVLVRVEVDATVIAREIEKHPREVRSAMQ